MSTKGAMEGKGKEDVGELRERGAGKTLELAHEVTAQALNNSALTAGATSAAAMMLVGCAMINLVVVN
jgi:hypothetical protein